MKTAVLQGFSCFKVKILSICLKTVKPKIPTPLALQHVEIQSFKYIINEKDVLPVFSSSMVKIPSICLKTLKPNINTFLALQYIEIHSFTYKSNEKGRFACFIVFYGENT